MALTEMVFRLKDFTNADFHHNAEVYFHPVQMNIRSTGWQNVFVDAPIQPGPPESGLYTIELEDRNFYNMEVLWHDGNRSRVGRSEYHGPFMVPVTSENESIALPDVIGRPPRNGMIRVTTSDPTSSLLDQYVYNETTGDLFERTA